MKKSTKLFLALAAMTTIGFSASAQLKECDLGITVTSPAADATFKYGDTLWLEFDIKNNGPDAITPTDTLWVAAGVEGGSASIFALPTAGIANNVTLPIKPGLYIRNQTTQDADVNICVTLIPQSNVYLDVNGSDTTWATVTYEDPNEDNNQSCAAVTLKAQTNSIIDIAQKEELGIYPNPATSVINMDMNLTKSENVVATVRDIAGREVLRQDFGRVQAGNAAPFTVSVSALNPGLYFVELNAGERKAIGKVTVK